MYSFRTFVSDIWVDTRTLAAGANAAADAESKEIKASFISLSSFSSFVCVYLYVFALKGGDPYKKPQHQGGAMMIISPQYLNIAPFLSLRFFSQNYSAMF